MKIKAPVLESDRLILYPLGLSHASQEYVNWMNDPLVNKHLESGGDYTMQKLIDFLNKIETENILFWGIHLKENNKHIGNIKIDPINPRHNYAEYGILMGDRFEWRKGYAKEASLLVIDYCFSKKINLRKINLGVLSKNIVAIKLYESIGFITEGVFHKHVITEEGFDDILRMAIFNPNDEF